MGTRLCTRHSGRAPTGVLQGVHLPVEYRAAILHAAVVPPTDDLPLVDEDGADRDAPLGQPDRRLGDGALQKFVHRLSSSARCQPGTAAAVPRAEPTSYAAERTRSAGAVSDRSEAPS